MNGTNTAGITDKGSHDLPLPAVRTAGAPGAVDTNRGGPSSAAGAGAAALANCGTGITDFSVGVPCASGASGLTGRHITIVVVCNGAALARLGVTRFARRTTTSGDLAAILLGAGWTAIFLGAGTVVFLRRATGFFFAGAAAGEHSTSESTEARRSTGFCVACAVVSRLTAWPLAWLAVERLTAINAESVPNMS